MLPGSLSRSKKTRLSEQKMLRAMLPDNASSLISFFVLSLVIGASLVLGF